MRPDHFAPDQAPRPAILTRYRQLAAEGHVEPDPAQETAIAKLDALRASILQGERMRRPRAFGWLSGARREEPTPRGLYLWGPVGRGKTMLMDLFFEEVQVTRKRRLHFNAFMTDVHMRVHAARLALRAGKTRGEDPIPATAAALAAETQLLCLDEFAVTNIADAMILGRLFEALFAHDMIIVTTSNIAPEDLYRDGLNRALFLPFIALLKERMEVVLVDAPKDFRLEKLAGAPVFYVPADAGARAALDRAFSSLAGRRRGTPTSLHVLGHQIIIPEAAAGVARFSFPDLCCRPLGAVDYVALAERFHTLIVDDIPVITPGARDVAQRFILLIDTLYDRRVKLIASAAAEPFALYRAEEGREAFEFRRTASRLIEMQSSEYFALPRGRPAEISGIAET